MMELLYSVIPNTAATQPSRTQGKTRMHPDYTGWWPRYILADLYVPTFAIADAEAFLASTKMSESSKDRRSQAMRESANSFFKELTILLNRSLKCSNRSSSLSTLTIIESMFIAVLAGLTWFQTQVHEKKVST